MKFVKSGGYMLLAYVAFTAILSVIGHIYALQQIPDVIKPEDVSYWSEFAKFHLSQYVYNIDHAVEVAKDLIPKAVVLYAGGKLGEAVFHGMYKGSLQEANELIKHVDEKIVPEFYVWEKKNIVIPEMGISAIPSTELSS